jgi:hypothetical protein
LSLAAIAIAAPTADQLAAADASQLTVAELTDMQAYLATIGSSQRRPDR